MEDNSSQRQPLIQRRDATKAAYASAKNSASLLAHQLVDSQQHVRDVDAQGKPLQSELNAVQKRVGDLEGEVRRCQEPQYGRDPFAAYGFRIADVRRDLDKMQWHGTVPLGPLALHVELRPEWQSYADAIRSQLGNRLLSFAITDGRDRVRLKQVLNKSGKSSMMLTRVGSEKAAIVIYEPDLFDYASGEPSEQELTVLRALEASVLHSSHPCHVLRVLTHVMIRL